MNPMKEGFSSGRRNFLEGVRVLLLENSKFHPFIMGGGSFQ